MFHYRQSIGVYDIESPWQAFWLGKKTAPVHETMTITSLVHSQCRDSDIRRNIDQWEEANDETKEICRGAVWNDDPAITLWTDQRYDNWYFTPKLSVDYSEWIQVSRALGFGPLPLLPEMPSASYYPEYLNARSQAGDLLFLHSMARVEGEDPHLTKHDLLLWIEVMYRIAIGEWGFEEWQPLGNIELRDRPITSEDRFPFLRWFHDTSLPKASNTIKWMLSRDSEYRMLNIQRRALGSALHIIQDSFSHSHTRREEIQDDVPWKPHYGRIITFHVWEGQSHKKHSHYDHCHHDMSNLTVGDLDSFNAMMGVRDGINAGIKFVDFWAAATPWNEGVAQWLDEKVFGLSPDVTPAHHEI
ncbi:hypothetical protein QBC37DRAFT_433530 [Rhypophila decipiens]|uniref:Uncharacterized protein n=1 Tax=Rhypophila decipiens TaxID=261697 RepID=A0AAN6XX99_9PEZI|nr:hypothetical protein QBC37DRAFT_433530 [Rhypophila decipiens]